MIEIKRLEINDYTYRLGQKVKNVDLGIEGHVHLIEPRDEENKVDIYIKDMQGVLVLYKVFKGHPYEAVYGRVQEEGSKNENQVG